MSQIVIGQSNGKNVHLDIKTLLRSHLLIWASTGGGKSYLIRRLAERLFGKVPIILIDREGEFPTLREKYGFVLVGPRGETTADPRSAKLVAERLLEFRASAVCDLFELGIEARHEWVRNFYLALINAPKNLWGPTVVILDEAHTFAPEKGQGESIAYPAVTDFNGVARKRGFASILATQRLSKLSKNATAEMYNQAAGPTAQQSDRDRAAYEMGIPKGQEAREFSETLRTLEPGHFFFQGRAIAMDRVLVTVGQVETSHGTETTGKNAAKRTPTPEEVKKLLPKLTDLPKEAEEKARTESELRAEVRHLEAQLRQQAKGTATAEAAPKLSKEIGDLHKVIGVLNTLVEEAMKIIVKITAIGFEKTDINPEDVQKALMATAKEIQRLAYAGLKKRAAEFEDLKRQASTLMVKMKKALAKENVTVDVAVKHAEPFSVQASPPPRPTSDREVVPNGDLSRPQLKVLTALAEFESIGVKEPTRSMVASWMGVKAGTGSFKNYLSELRVRKLMRDGMDERLSLTDAARQYIPAVNAAVTTAELLSRSTAIFGQTTGKILRFIHGRHPEYVTRESIAAHLGISSETGSFKNYISELRTAGMLVDGDDKTVKAADWLFLG